MAALCAVMGAATMGSAAAQWWPWAKEEPPPRPKKVQPPDENLFEPGAPTGPPFGSRPPGTNLCLQLEQRLVAEVQGTGQGRELLPKIESDIRDAERIIRSGSAKLERYDCWESFFFTKSLRTSSRRCRQLNDEVENAQRRLADLDRQRKQILGTGDRSMQDEIIRELARNGCGDQYVREAKKRDAMSNPFAMLFGGEEMDPPKGPGNKFGTLPFATYRTLCVRLCDGYYFPISFSTLPNHFERDAQVCHSQCAAPAELYYHQNPGGSVEQMLSFATEQPYTDLKSAFRYRKEYVAGCSCKRTEYDPVAIEAGETPEKKAETPPGSPGSGVKIGSKR